MGGGEGDGQIPCASIAVFVRVLTMAVPVLVAGEMHAAQESYISSQPQSISHPQHPQREGNDSTGAAIPRDHRDSVRAAPVPLRTDAMPIKRFRSVRRGQIVDFRGIGFGHVVQDRAGLSWRCGGARGKEEE